MIKYNTKKERRNIETHIYVDLNELFTSSNNIQYMIDTLHLTYRENGGRANKAQFAPFVIRQAHIFAQKDLNEYQTAEINATGYNNYVDALRAINADFTALCHKYFSWNEFNPFKATYEVGQQHCRVLKKGYEFNADDHGTLDVWHDQMTQILNRNFRDNNEVPNYRRHLNTRHYSRESEGLRTTPARASLEDKPRGYDMQDIYDIKYKSEDFY